MAATDLLEYLFSAKGTDELYEALRTRSASEIEEVCRTFPIEELSLAGGSLSSLDMRSIQRFELVTILAQVLINYDKILEQNPELRLPASLPAGDLSDILMSRLMPFIASQQGVNIAQTLRIRLYDFAMALMGAQRDRDALTCLLVSRPSMKEDHDFWICACRYNVAQVTEDADDIAAAIECVRRIVDGEVKVPEKYVQGAKQMLDRLEG